jgi:hypothetical protein
MIDLELARRLGDRHLRMGTGGDAATGEKKLVRVSIAADAGRTKGGQLLAWMLCNLLARQFAIIHGLEIRATYAANCRSRHGVRAFRWNERGRR